MRTPVNFSSSHRSKDKNANHRYAPFPSKIVSLKLKARVAHKSNRTYTKPYRLLTRLEDCKSGRKAKEKKTHDFLMADVALATSAAPTYFRPHKIKSVMLEEGKISEGKFVDGGLYANHPAMCAFVEARTQYPGTQVLLVSLGTGERDSFQDLNKKKGGLGTDRMGNKTTDYTHHF
ncbi:hypothetical protein F4055_05150 [Candidatus Poribacteria bacterium]|nr:hypothetical protein [Candidatus Poribacteria bacterium]